MFNVEMIVFIIYLLFMVGIGVYFFCTLQVRRR